MTFVWCGEVVVETSETALLNTVSLVKLAHMHVVGDVAVYCRGN